VIVIITNPLDIPGAVDEPGATIFEQQARAADCYRALTIRAR
jgi:hypothetical protein